MLRHPDGRELGAIALELPPAERRLVAAERLAALGTDPPPLILCVPEARALCRRLGFPLAVEENLEQALVYEIDRQTPFRAEEVYLDARVLERDEAARQIAVEMIVVPRAFAAPALAAAREAGLPLFGLDALDEEGRPRGFNLLPRGERVRPPDPRRKVNLALGAAAIALALLAMQLSLANRAEAVRALRAEVERLHREAREVAALRERLERAVAAAGFLAERRAAQPPVVLLLDELSRLLPDDTFLEHLNLSKGELVLHGFSSSAAGLIGALREARHLAEPSFQGAIRPDPRYGKERFELKAATRMLGARPARGGGRMSRDRLLAVLLLLAALGLVYLLGVHWWFVAGHRALARELADLGEQAARFRGLIAQRPEIEARLAEVEALDAANPGFLQDPSFDQASATLITRLRQATERHAGLSPQGCMVLSNQPIRSREAEVFLRVTLNVQMRCGLEAFAAVLRELEGGSPMLFVDELSIFARRFGRPVGGVALPHQPQDFIEYNFALYGYLRQPGGADAR
ncbi:MAG: type II secretion system protein GspM [Xanthomonadales bacterium]|nr:type II secretion system protein GspM [Xanthomonadales bacterium]